MDEQRRQMFLAELEDAIRERDELDTFIAVLAKRLGIEIPQRANDSAVADKSPTGHATGDPVAAVTEGQFFGKSGPKASKELLEMFGPSRPLKTDEIFQAVKKGGVQIGSAGTLYRSLTRDGAFLRVGRGRWGLAEWYPEAAKRKAGAPTEDGPQDREESPEAQSGQEPEEAERRLPPNEDPDVAEARE